MAAFTMNDSTEQSPLLISNTSNSLHHTDSKSSSRHSSSEISPGHDGDDHDADQHQQSQSPGVARMAAISSQLTNTQRTILFASIFLVGYAYGLEAQVRVAYQPYATASFNLHSYQATINVLRSIVAVAVQPTAAKVADVFGRFEVVAFSMILYTLGIAIEASAISVEMFCTGSIIYQMGYTCIILLLEVLVADFSSMRARVFFSYIPAMPFLINTWISGNVTSAVLSVTTWRWGLGMWAIIFPLASAPLLCTLYYIEHHYAGKGDGVQRQQGPANNKLSKGGIREVSAMLYHQLDVVGLVTLVVSFSMILAPLTITGREVNHWRDPHIVVPLVMGLILASAFVVWEQRGARHPLIPFRLLADRGVWAALAVRSLLNLAWYTQGTYLFTVLVVAFDFSVESATRIMSFFSFFGVISGVIVGAIIYRLRRLKLIIVIGTCIFMVAFGLLIKFSGGADSHARNGLIGAQILMGLAGGLFAYPTQASIQASATREHVAILTGLYLSFYNVGSALGTCLSGAIWTQTLLRTLQDHLAFQPDSKLAEEMYDSPFEVVADYPVGTEIRGAIIDSYKHVQRMMCVAGICVCVPMIVFALALRNPKLSKEYVQPEAEAEAEVEECERRPSVA